MSAQSPLLNLPGELRNRIYEFALTSRAPIYYSKTLATVWGYWDHEAKPHVLVTRTPDKDRDEFNQLKYVNKQLYAETAGLEVKYSKIIIERSRLVNPPPKVLLICWRRSASAAKRAWIDQANIHEDDFRTESYGPMNVCGSGGNLG